MILIFLIMMNILDIYALKIRTAKAKHSFQTLLLISWLADGDSLMYCIVTMGGQIAKMFSTFSL